MRRTFLLRSRRFITTLRDHALGPFFQADQVWNRIEPSAFYGAVLLASHVKGWSATAARLNRVPYSVCKTLLRCSGTSLGVGGYSGILHELGVRWRLSTRLAFNFLIIHARLFCLPQHFEAATPFHPLSLLQQYPKDQRGCHTHRKWPSSTIFNIVFLNMEPC